jgi:hypothetical protein
MVCFIMICLTNNYFRCLAHVINLATQALISGYSTSKHYNPHDPAAHELSQDNRDEVGIIRTITVKVSPSINRNESLLTYI